MQNRTLSREIRFAAAEVLEVGFTLLYPSPRSRSSFLSELIRSHVDKPMDSDDANLHLLRRLLLMFSSSDGVVSLLPTGSSNSDDDIVDLIRLLFEIASRDEAAIALLRTYQRILISQVSDNRKDVSLRLALINYAQCLFESCNQVLQRDPRCARPLLEPNRRRGAVVLGSVEGAWPRTGCARDLCNGRD